MTDIKKKRKVIRSEGREMIAKVFHYLAQEYKFMKEQNYDNCDLTPLSNIRRRTAEATGVSETTVTTVLREERNLPSPSARFPSPNTARSRKKNSKNDINNPSLEVIRDTIASYHKEHREIPSLTKLKEVIKQNIDQEKLPEIEIVNIKTENPEDCDDDAIEIEVPIEY